MIYWPFDSVVSDDGEGNLSYDREFDSANLRKIFKGLYTNGIAMTEESGALQVVPSSGMNLTVNSGFVIIEGAMGYQEESMTVVLDAASETYGRIDSIVARLNTNISGRCISIEYVKGTEAAVPAAPALERSGGIYDLRLANIRIPAGTTAITASMITDTRLGSECGVATARPQEVDTASIFSQYQASLDEYMQYVQDCINETVAGDLQNQVDEMQDPDVESSLAGQVKSLREAVDRLNTTLTRSNKLITELSSYRNLTNSGFQFNNKYFEIQYIHCVGKLVIFRGLINGSWNTATTPKWSTADSNTVKLKMPKGFKNIGTIEFIHGSQTVQSESPIHFELGMTDLKTYSDGSVDHLIYGFATGLKANAKYRFQLVFIRNGNIADMI